MVETALILALIAVVVIVALRLVGGQLNNVFYNITHTRGLNPCTTTTQTGQCR